MCIMWETDYALLSALLLGLVGWLVWWWNEFRYVFPVKARCSTSSPSLSKPKLPPGHLGLPLVGEILSFTWYFSILRRPDDFINSKRLRYGDNVGVYRTYLFGCPSIIACSPSICKLVLQSSHLFRQDWPTYQVLGSNSIVTVQGGHHHDMIRSLINNTINSRDALEQIVLQIQPNVVVALQSWSQKGKIKTVDEVKKVTLKYLARYFANFEVGPQMDEIEKLLWGMTEGFRAQPWNFLGATYNHALKCRKKLIKIFNKELEKRKENKQYATSMIDSDLMDELIRVKDKEGKLLSDREVVDNILSSINTSYSSIAYAVTWAVYFLAKFPLVLLKLREENMEMSKEKKGEYITYEDISKLKYTLKVVKETLRVGNLSGFIFKKATEDIEYKGYIIPKGWRVLVWIRYLHTDPQNFENPMCFNPDRWDSSPKLGTYLPFGGGARICPGSMLARVNLAIFLHHLSTGYKWELLNPDTPIRYLSHAQPTDGAEISISKI